jgi:hypothetical protein
MNWVFSLFKRRILRGNAMNWFKIRVNDGREHGYTYVGASADSPEDIAKKSASGEYIRLDNLRYWDRGTVKKWEEWDASLIPAVHINPRTIVSIMQFKGDPAATPR